MTAPELDPRENAGGTSAAPGNDAEQNAPRRHLTSAERQQLYRERAEHRRRATVSAEKRKKRRLAIILSAAVLTVAAATVGTILLFDRVITPQRNYNEALSLFKAGEYMRALDIFDEMGDYLDCREYVERCILEQARTLAGRDDVLVGSTADMPWFSFDTDAEEEGMIKFDSELYRGEGDISIPDVFDGVLVRGIAERAFYRCDFLTSISLPPSIRSIGERAFYGCERLTSVTIPDNVSIIGENAFSACTALESVSFGAGLKTISQRAFDNCTALGEITLGGSVEYLGYRAFGGCTAVESLSLPATLKTVEAGAFVGIDKLTAITFGGTREELLTLLGDDAATLTAHAEIKTAG